MARLGSAPAPGPLGPSGQWDFASGATQKHLEPLSLHAASFSSFLATNFLTSEARLEPKKALWTCGCAHHVSHMQSLMAMPAAWPCLHFGSWGCGPAQQDQRCSEAEGQVALSGQTLTTAPHVTGAREHLGWGVLACSANVLWVFIPSLSVFLERQTLWYKNKNSLWFLEC